MKIASLVVPPRAIGCIRTSAVCTTTAAFEKKTKGTRPGRLGSRRWKEQEALGPQLLRVAAWPGVRPSLARGSESVPNQVAVSRCGFMTTRLIWVVICVGIVGRAPYRSTSNGTGTVTNAFHLRALGDETHSRLRVPRLCQASQGGVSVWYAT